MIEKDNIKHNIKYKKIGDIFYPIFDDAEPALGYYATEKLNYLKEQHPSKYLLFKYSHKYNYLFLIAFVNNFFKTEQKYYLKTINLFQKLNKKNYYLI